MCQALWSVIGQLHFCLHTAAKSRLRAWTGKPFVSIWTSVFSNEVTQPKSRVARRSPKNNFSLFNAYNFNLSFYIYVSTILPNEDIKWNVINWRNHLYEFFSLKDSYTTIGKILWSLYFLCIFFRGPASGLTDLLLEKILNLSHPRKLNKLYCFKNLIMMTLPR